MTYYHKEDNLIYVWEYIVNTDNKLIEDNITDVNFIYEGNKKDLTLNQIIENFSTFCNCSLSSLNDE